MTKVTLLESHYDIPLSIFVVGCFRCMHIWGHELTETKPLAPHQHYTSFPLVSFPSYKLLTEHLIEQLWRHGNCTSKRPLTLTHIFKVIQPCLCNKTAQIWHILRSMANTILDGSFPYLAHMITSMRVCVAGYNLLPWPTSFGLFVHDFSIKILKYGTQWPLTLTIYSKLFSRDFAYCMDLIHMWHWYNSREDDLIGQVSSWHG